MISRITDFLATEFLFSIIVFIIVYIFSRLLSRKAPLFVYGLWFLVLLRLILPTSLSFDFSLSNLLLKLTDSAVIDYGGPGFFSESLIELSKPSETPVQTITNLSFNWPSILFSFWLAGVLYLAFLYLLKIRLYHAILKNAAICKKVKVLQIVEFWRTEFGIHQQVKLVSSDTLLAPFTTGIFKPAIFVPEKILATNDFQILNSIVAHEMAHIKRKDAILLKLQGVLQIVYFFNPVVWFTNLKINNARELICDGMVLRSGKINKKVYGESLINVLNMRLSSPTLIQLNAGIGSNKFKSRIKNIMEGTKMKSTNPVFSFMIILAIAVFVLPLANKGTAKNATAPNKILLSPPEFDLPLKSGKVSARFGATKHPKKDKMVHHKGIDIRAKKGTKIFAPKSGTVVKVKDPVVDTKKGYGKHVVIDHGSGLKSLYSHMSKILVSEGDEIKVGQNIGLVGSTGLSTGPHLHYEIRKDDKPVDPELYSDFSSLNK